VVGVNIDVTERKALTNQDVGRSPRRFDLTSLSESICADFNLALIPSAFSVRPNRSFDPGYMAAVFEAGLNHMVSAT
jgi:hypothetical protein